jgi:hypothetical protein
MSGYMQKKLIEMAERQLSGYNTTDGKRAGYNTTDGKRAGILLDINAQTSDATMPKQDCSGCTHLGKYENEVEYGTSSPCTLCKRRCHDNYTT